MDRQVPKRGKVIQIMIPAKIMGKAIKMIAVPVVLSTLGMGNGFQGQINTTYNDTVKNAHVILKQNDQTINETYSDSNGYYNITWTKVNEEPKTINNFEVYQNYPNPFNPITKLPFTLHQNGNTNIQIYNIKGELINQKNENLNKGSYTVTIELPASGIYFARISQGKYNQTIKMIKLDGNVGNNISISVNKASHAGLTKPTENDSLIVEYTNNDMKLQRYAETITQPPGTQIKNITLQRTLRNPTIEIDNIPENPTIDTEYIMNLNSYSPDYDGGEINLNLEHTTGDSITFYFNGTDTFTLNPHTKGYHTFTLTATDTRGLNQQTNINFNIQSKTYKILLTKLYNGLGLPRQGLDISLKGKTARTDSNGIAILEYNNYTNLTSQDSMDIEDNILGNLQDNTGPFAAMRIGIKPELINSEQPHTQQTFTDEMMRQNPNYWDSYVWTNQLDREFYLLALMLNDTYTIPKRGSIEEGFTNMLHYSPAFHNGIVDYREYTQITIDSIRTAITALAINENGEGNTPLTFINIAPADSQLAIDQGNTFDFTTSSSGGAYMNGFIDPETGIWYITRSGQYINNALGGHSLFKDMFHELGRAIAYVTLTPYSPDAIEDVMGIGDVQPHDMIGYYTMMNIDPKFFSKVKNLRSILPNSEPYWPD